ncbi:MAG TPA: M28 family metallopeptidase [Verrucomicrobiae bacterium]|jgi:carboxypeptidase Q|nr:M28 family metallopeptidase [Verrucomicrobiae bacterium]
MSNRFVLAAGLLGTLVVSVAAGPVEQLMEAATRTNFAYMRLARLCDTFGPRFSGSPNLTAAQDWILAEMKRDGLENVHGEDVSVPHWVRGVESAEMLQPRPRALPMLGLGGSVATPPGGLSAEVLVVTNFADLRARPQDARGKIVLFNQPFTTYAETVLIRYHGATEAAQAGAVASLIRSVTPFSIQSPHTGMMEYSNDIPKIPHAAITVEDAEMMQRMQERGEKIVVHLTMNATNLPDAPSRNLIAEITGREHPEDVVIVSGHLDSWDVGQGAMDDGGGAVAAWETARLMHELGLRARRTIRVVLWTNEENGGAGARSYEHRHKDQLGHHVLAIESDSGPFRPTGFSLVGSESALAVIKQFAQALKPIGADHITTGQAEADVGELGPDGVPTLALEVDGAKYFWYHHTQADTMDKLNPRELSQCAAAMAAMAYQAADADSPLPR